MQQHSPQTAMSQFFLDEPKLQPPARRLYDLMKSACVTAITDGQNEAEVFFIFSQTFEFFDRRSPESPTDKRVKLESVSDIRWNNDDDSEDELMCEQFVYLSDAFIFLKPWLNLQGVRKLELYLKAEVGNRDAYGEDTPFNLSRHIHLSFSYV